MVTITELLDLLACGFNKFMYDQFLSTENINSAVTGTGEVTSELMELRLNTGNLAGSTAKAYYNNNIFNPHYSAVYFHLFLDNLMGNLEGDISDVRLFFGFKESSADIDWADAVQIKESSAGLMIDEVDGRPGLYSYTSRLTSIGPPPDYIKTYSQQKTKITGLDPTRDLIYKIEFDKFSTFPLPQIIPYFDTFRIITPDRIWTLRSTNSTYPPEDKLHYLFFCIKSTTGAEKILRIKAVTYGEEYAD